jgi:hypothetical protein
VLVWRVFGVCVFKQNAPGLTAAGLANLPFFDFSEPPPPSSVTKRSPAQVRTHTQTHADTHATQTQAAHEMLIKPRLPPFPPP